MNIEPLSIKLIDAICYNRKWKYTTFKTSKPWRAVMEPWDGSRCLGSGLTMTDDIGEAIVEAYMDACKVHNHHTWPGVAECEAIVKQKGWKLYWSESPVPDCYECEVQVPQEHTYLSFVRFGETSQLACMKALAHALEWRPLDQVRIGGQLVECDAKNALRGSERLTEAFVLKTFVELGAQRDKARTEWENTVGGTEQYNRAYEDYVHTSSAIGTAQNIFDKLVGPEESFALRKRAQVIRIGEGTWLPV